MATFEDFALPEDLLAGIAQAGFTKPTPVQQLTIPPALEGADILGAAPTGTGKTAAFLLPVIARLMREDRPGVRAVILEPTRELAMQVAADCNALCVQVPEIKAYTIIGGAGRDEQKAAEGNIVVATPGRLKEFFDKEWFDPSTVEVLVLDEADRMLDMGFHDEVSVIVRELNRRQQTMLFSATLEGAAVQDFSEGVLNDPFEVRLGAGAKQDEKLPELLTSRAYYARTPEQKYAILKHLLTTATGQALIFVRTRERVDELCAFLRKNGFDAASLQGDMNITERKAALRRFSAQEVRFLVATDVAARGLDVPSIEKVYNFDLPAKADVYVHRAGRTARAGARGSVICLVGKDELEMLQRIVRYTGRDIEQRVITAVSDPFPKEKQLPQKRNSRTRMGEKGGFSQKKRKGEDKDDKPREKKRWRDLKNKGKPDFAAKRAKKALRLKQQEEAAATAAERKVKKAGSKSAASVAPAAAKADASASESK